jgi:hypothetical protein
LLQRRSSNRAFARGLGPYNGNPGLPPRWPPMAGDEIVFAIALQNQESRRGLTAVGCKMRALRPNQIGFARREAHLLLGFAQEDLEVSLEHVKGVLDVRVTVPRHLLRGVDRVLGDPKPRMRGVIRLSLSTSKRWLGSFMAPIRSSAIHRRGVQQP